MGNNWFDAVVIGRNEGARLVRSLESIAAKARRVVYVDSGSVDDSVAQARAIGIDVIELDVGRPFTAARGRNAGFQALDGDRLDFVQFLDGDCILQPCWPEQALAHMTQHPRAGLVFGRQFEAAPEASVYNWLIDWEWDKPLGAEAYCAGCLMVRTEAFVNIGGYNETLIAGEDDDMCHRMQRAGWQTWRIQADMTEHDARLLSLRPWWRRMLRAGHSYAELGVLHPGVARTQQARAMFWAVVLPIVTIFAATIWPPLAGVAVLYAVSIGRQARRFSARGLTSGRALQAAFLLMLGKFAELAGMSSYWLARLRGTRRKLIEYK